MSSNPENAKRDLNTYFSFGGLCAQAGDFNRQKAVRHKLFLSQQAMAKTLNVSFSTVNRWERGHAEPQYKPQADFDSLCKKHEIVFTDKGIKE